MAIYSFKPAFRKALAPFERALVRVGVSADAITVAGIFFAGLAGLGVWLGRSGTLWLLLVPVGCFLRTAANALDGMVAVSTGTTRPLGEVLNETADRIGDVACFLPVALVPGVDDLLVAGSLAAMLVTSFLGVSIKAAGGPRVYTGVMGKPDRMLVLGAAAVIALFLDSGVAFTVALWIVMIGSLVTILQRSAVGRRELRVP
jgi:CDP-diacylglycerol--glycerol-3-phosphate 3-phosphatidyltransferase